ncbi:hypothetical protein BMS3Abin01_00567 [bacterium BMS3Abin01]|nr:hypothetical protein BMS3Abin01_00567 [bacterium BMS3Abin01]HDY69568.1 hypothetical protein [Actinomycetota bacterium]
MAELQDSKEQRELDGRRRQKTVTIVGVCGSGKTLLSEGLKQLGYEARSVSQEHSLVPDLFARSRPDIVIYLETADGTVARRRQTGWEPGQLARQRQRLKLARDRADIHISTDGLEPEELLMKAIKELESGF